MFESLQNIFQSVITESVDANTIEQLMDGNKRVVLRYVAEDGIPTVRQVELFALGLSTAGNEVVRAFQINHKPSAHDTKSGEWKLFRLDRIESVRPTNYNVRYMYPYLKKQLRNPNGDRSMSQVFKVSAPGYEAFTGDLEAAQTRDTNVTPGPIRQSNTPIGTYTTKAGDRLNIVGFKSRNDGKHIIAVTDTGGHLFINPNNLKKDFTPTPGIGKISPTNPKDWSDSLKKSLDDVFAKSIADEANEDLDNASNVGDNKPGPIETGENNNTDDYNNDKEESKTT